MITLEYDAFVVNDIKDDYIIKIKRCGDRTTEYTIYVDRDKVLRDHPFMTKEKYLHLKVTVEIVARSDR